MTKNESGKKTKKGLSIRAQLFLVSITVISLIVLLGLFVYYSINRIHNINTNYAIILSIDDCIEKMTNAESTFILKESEQNEFYTNQNVRSVVTFKGYANKLNEQVGKLSPALKNSRLIKKYEIENLDDIAKEYESLFDSLILLTQLKGFQDYGAVGEMAAIAYDLENSVSKTGNQDLYIQVLQLNKDEKEYFLRKDPSYFEQFKRDAARFISAVNTSILDPTVSEQLITKTKKYQNLLEKISEYDSRIGLTNSIGLLNAINEKSNHITELSEVFIQTFSAVQVKEIRKVKVRFLIVLAIIITTLSIIIRKIRLTISVPFNHIKNSLQSLSLGVIPKSLTESKSSQEIRDITRLLNKIIYGFNNTIQFAKNLKEGKFDESFDPLSQKDDLGNALLKMKDGLIEAQKERDKQHDEEIKQAWINKGTAEFAEVLNQNHKNTEEFTYSIISKLVKYLDANQGGFFIMRKDNINGQYLELASAIAYDRRKYVNDHIAIGEGFVGSSVVENNIFYRTEIPEDYISITSGMGGSNPRVLLIVPLVLDDEIYGALEIASFKEFEEYQIEFVKAVSENITTTMSSVKNKEETEKLLEQSQAQAEQIIQAEEEMRQNLEEMQATQEEAARREEQLREELSEANKTISRLESQLNEITK